ncbi:E3 ubiquitin-protein ligase listerin [Clonorchis sinensis]|uniref:E3 ubiquitin-protein ligase listerin n=1 Tax=Clonorchis sinensis TaxID=79923 RepID=H2KPJ4_CLOSI|nr:E3 ubiquitin-protein ligase listerin [Clonorchis sinensis]
MGGKKKTGHAQPRTKDNLKPSSSEKAAQFLVNQTGGLGLPFPLLSVSAAKRATSSATDSDQLGRITGFVPVPQDPDAVGLDSRLLNILRRLEKRDSVTKQKALREFYELLKATGEQSSSDLETSAVVATLPFWCRIYTRLSSDPDRKVRELLQMSMSVLAARVGREIGPYIKQILPIWAFATIDFHEPAASWANRGLSDTFPNAKRSDAYKVCARTVLDLLESKLSEDLMTVSNLINEKGKKKHVLNLSGNTETSAMSDLESCENNMWVKLAGTLRFVATVAIEIGDLPSDSRHLERLRVLLSPGNLWSRVAQILECQKSGSSSVYRPVAGNSSLVRASLYKLCTALCSNHNWQDWMVNTPQGNQLASYLCLSTIGQIGLILGDPPPSGMLSGYKLIPPPPSSIPVPSCYAQCWESALSCLVNLPSDIVWSAVDWKSVLVPQLERLLSASGVPYAKQVYSNLLSILSKFPIEYDAMTQTQEDILMSLFVDSALSGLEASLTPRVSSGIDDPKAPVTVHVDPGIPVSIVTGVLECARFLIDKLATAFPQLSSNDLSTQSPLLHAVVNKVVIRLLADSLDVLSDHRILLVSSQPATYRETYLNAVFSQVKELLFSYLSLEVGDVEAADCPSNFTYSLHRLLISAVVYLPYVPSRLIRFAERLRKPLHDPSLALLWLSELAEMIKQTVRDIMSGFSEPTALLPPSRHLLPGFGCAVDAARMGSSMRLHELGLRLGLPQELKSNVTWWNVYLQCLGILRVWLCSLGDTYDPCVAFGWPIEKRTDIAESGNKYSGVDLEPARSVFGHVVDSYASELGRMWYQNTADIPLDELFELMQTDHHSISPLACANIQDCFLVHSLLNAVLLNRLRTVHPNLWPHHFKLIASCTDDPKQPNSSWSERHLFSDGCFDQPSGVIQFHQLCELYIPAGVVRRCVPHQELLGRMKSLAVAPTTLGDCESATSCAKASRILELGSSLFGVRTASPAYMTTFLSFITEDFNTWLTELVEGSDGDEFLGLWAFQSGFVASLATMEFLESLLLLWQPWQWRPTHVTDKATFTNHLCLIQLSLRLEQLRPSLTRSQWDFIMCITVSWICAAVAGASDVTDPVNHKTLFGFHVFRVAAALGAIFVEKFPPPKDLSYFLIPSTTPLKSVVSHFGGGEWDDDLDAEAEELDLKEDALVIDDASNKQDHQEVFDETQLLDTLPDDHDELEATLTEEEENRESSPNMQHPVLPRRARPPVFISTDWEQFFSSHFYSSLLPVILKLCLPQPGLIQPGCKSMTPVQLEAACAAFATCSAIKLIQVLTEQPQFIVEYLVDLDIGGSTSTVYTPLIRSRTSSVNELTPGLRASFDLAIRLLRFSPYQSGQLLGHILLTRLVCAHTNRTDCNKTYALSSYLIHRLPPSWLAALYDSLPAELEQDLVLESLSNNWGRGSRVLCYLIKFSLQDGWFLDVMAHQSILRYLLAWDGILSLFSCTGSQGRARLQRALLGSAAPLFDRFVLCLGLLIPPPGNLATFINTPSRLEPDERLLLPVSASRADLIVALSLISPSRQRRPIRLSVPLTSGDDREWRDAFAPDDPLLTLSGVRIARDISHLAVRLFRRLLAEAPALFRSWFTRISSPSTADPCCLDGESLPPVISPLAAHKPGRLRQLANTIEAVVSRHFSPGLARDEVVMVQYRAQLRETKRDNTTPKGWFDFLSPSNEVGSISIRSRPLSREVIARYQVTEEHSMEMSIQLPTNYPLGLATVTCDRAVAISSQQGNVWSVQLSVFINNQNGSILDGIDLWQRNVRKKFEGVEECAICYSVVHNTNFSLPKMQCHTCRKLFHYACMYRWFTTSRNPACPLCRHMFFGPSGRPT